MSDLNYLGNGALKETYLKFLFVGLAQDRATWRAVGDTLTPEKPLFTKNYDSSVPYALYLATYENSTG